MNRFFVFSKLRFAVLLVSLGSLSLACDGNLQKSKEADDNQRDSQLTPAPSRQHDIDAFGQSLYPLLRQHCAACHSSFVSPQFASAEIDEAYDIIQSFLSQMPEYLNQALVDFENTDESRIYFRLKKDQHSCWTNCDQNAEELLEKINLWKELRKGNGQIADCTQEQTGSRKIRLLSNAEYLNTIRDLFGEQAIARVNLPNDISRRNLFDNIGQERPVQLSQLNAYYEAANQVASNILDQGLFQCNEVNQCLNQWFQEHAWRLWRRPIQQPEETSLRELFTLSLESNQSIKEALKQLITASLISPNFLYRSELGQLQDNGTYLLDSWEIASALSYFFWRTLPDKQLFDLAQKQLLQNPEQIQNQVSRLLSDDRSRRGLGDFVQLWTRSYRILDTEKAGAMAELLPRSIREKLARETVDFFMHMVFEDEDGDYQSLMTSPYSIGDESLARFYGVARDHNGRLDFSQSQRRGLASQGSLMASYAFPDESSPIHRGVFILENLLCRHFPEPPAVTIPDREENKSNRDRFKDHSKLAECAVCHTQIDGVGFGFEHFDGLGLYREFDAGKPVDASGQLEIDGREQRYDGAAEFNQILGESRDGSECFTRQALRFQSGAVEVSNADQCRINRVYEAFAADGYQLKALMHHIFADPAFLNRRSND